METSYYVLSLVIALPLLVMIVGPILYLVRDTFYELLGMYGDNEND